MTVPTAPPSLDGFTYVEVLGVGGQATVFKYAQPAFSRMVAVKVLHGRLDPTTQRAFEAETRTMGQLSAHPNVVSIYEAGITAAQSAYFVMEFCPPPNLWVRVRKLRRPYGVPDALRTGIQIAGAVERAHSLRILHRDIKPANILVTEYGSPALTDFGIAASLAGAEPSAAEGFSIPWAPPEQLIAGAALTPAADVYSLAATLWTLLVGRSPFEIVGGDNRAPAMSRRVRSDPVPPVRRPDVPTSLDRVLTQALDKLPEQRCRSAAELARALQRVEADLHLPQTPFVGGQIAFDAADGEGEEDRGSTRFVAYVPIDPDGRDSMGPSGRHTTPGMTRPDLTNVHPEQGPGFIAHSGSGVAGIRDFTGPPVPDLQLDATDVMPERQAGHEAPPMPPQSVEEGPRRSGGRVAAIVAVAALVLIAAVVSISTLFGDRNTAGAATSTSTTVNPMSAVGDVVPPVTDVTMTRAGSRFTIDWKVPNAQPGDSVMYRVYRRGETPPDYARAARPLKVTALDGTTCVDLVRVRANQSSEDQGMCS